MTIAYFGESKYCPFVDMWEDIIDDINSYQTSYEPRREYKGLEFGFLTNIKSYVIPFNGRSVEIKFTGTIDEHEYWDENSYPDEDGCRSTYLIKFKGYLKSDLVSLKIGDVFDRQEYTEIDWFATHFYERYLPVFKALDELSITNKEDWPLLINNSTASSKLIGSML